MALSRKVLTPTRLAVECSDRNLLQICKHVKRFTHLDLYSEILHNNTDALMNSRYNKGLSFTMRERQLLSIHGLMPCSIRPIEEQVEVAKLNFMARHDPLGQYTYLMSLRQLHERVFFRFIREHTELTLPIMYTPTVGSAVTLFSTVYRSGMGMYVTIYDRGHIFDVLKNWRVPNVRGVCVTDGGRILGLGDMGANGMGIVLGKLFLYTALGGVPPNLLLPITLDVGTDNKMLLEDPHYVGARLGRIKGAEYDDFVEEFMQAVAKCFGDDTLIHFEDFATPNAYKFLRKYQHKYSYFNDDIQGTSAIGLAGFLAAERLLKYKLEDQVFLFVGAGSAAIGIANLLVRELRSRGLSKEKACSNIYVVEMYGLLTTKSKGLNEDTCRYAKDIEPIVDLEEVVDKLKPAILLAATGTAGVISEKVLRLMAQHNERPVVFALSNPTSNAECTAEQAFQHTEGRVIFSSGSPFPPVVVNGKRFTTGQANNCLAFPGIALGALSMRARHLPDEIYLKVAHVLANYPSEESLKTGNLYPLISEVNDLSFSVAMSVADFLDKNNLSNVHPMPKDICKFMHNYMYRLSYGPSLPNTWKYPPFKRISRPKKS
ncbi:NADP-dependent malic enzyme-like [Drosophila innubila]|uniref:NADP-dependent malic enzyme-like n=1 Tax=Drosophila innubila TaxID=198719 RepID=UPI00148E5E7C|nr:NADP-dependent malic enzyme-like [Drosophila innubila]